MAAVHPLLDQTRDLLAASLAGSSAEQLSHHPSLRSEIENSALFSILLRDIVKRVSVNRYLT